MRIGLAWCRGARFTAPMTALHDYFHRQFHSPDTVGGGAAS